MVKGGGLMFNWKRGAGYTNIPGPTDRVAPRPPKSKPVRMEFGDNEIEGDYMRVHHVKLLPQYFDLELRKPFEIRKNDRDYRVDDVILLNLWEDGTYRQMVWDEDGMIYRLEPVDDYVHATTIMARIGSITDYEQREDYVVLGLVDMAVLETTLVRPDDPNDNIFVRMLNMKKGEEQDV